jgi:hypothetical protein
MTASAASIWLPKPLPFMSPWFPTNAHVPIAPGLPGGSLRTAVLRVNSGELGSEPVPAARLSQPQDRARQATRTLRAVEAERGGSAAR